MRNHSGMSFDLMIRIYCPPNREHPIGFQYRRKLSASMPSTAILTSRRGATLMKPPVNDPTVVAPDFQSHLGSAALSGNAIATRSYTIVLSNLGATVTNDDSWPL